MSLARGAARGAAWNFGTVLAERAFGFIILGLLLRKIPASVVGLVAIASAISDLARMVSNSGAGELRASESAMLEPEAALYLLALLGPPQVHVVVPPGQAAR